MDLAWLKEQTPCFDVNIYLKGPESVWKKKVNGMTVIQVGLMKLHDLVLITIQEISKHL